MVIKPLSAILYQVEVVMRVITGDDQLLELVPGDRSVIEKSLSTIYAPNYPPTVSGLSLWPSRVMRSRHPCNTPVYCTGGCTVLYCTVQGAVLGRKLQEILQDPPRRTDKPSCHQYHHRDKEAESYQDH